MSKKTFEVLGTSDHFEKYQSNVDTNWNLCFVFQEDGKGQLVCPAKSKSSDPSSGYQTVYENLKRFEDIGQIPFSLKRRLQDSKLVHNIAHKTFNQPAYYAINVIPKKTFTKLEPLRWIKGFVRLLTLCQMRSFLQNSVKGT
jgi:hypothetical protein